MTLKRVSVVMPTFNRAELLPRALGSVLAQTHPVHEVIVVDDGSTDRTSEVLEEARRRDPRVKSVHQENAGAAAARNRGVGIADGELLAFQDSDDVWEPAFLERMVKALEDRERTVVFASHTIASLTGEVETVPPHPLPDPARAMLRRNFASTQAVLLPAVLARATPFDAALPRFQDWDLWLSMLEQGVDFEHVPEVLVHLSRQADSISEGDPGLRAFALQRIFKKHFRLLARDPVAIPRLVARAWLRGRAVRPRGRAGSA